MNNVIPIMHCFDNNYVIPAAVAFYSLLEHADVQYNYKLYVLHSDITPENQKKLKETVSCFNNADIEFIDMNNKFEDVFAKLMVKGHFSKEVIYKLITPSLFPQYEKLMIADVDVVYYDDVAKNFTASNGDVYITGHHWPYKKNSWIDGYYNWYREDFNDEEVEILINGINGCYLIFNLKKMRDENIEEKLLNYLFNNLQRIRQLEQDVLNLVCYPKIDYLPCNTVASSYLYDLYQTDEDYKQDAVYNEFEIRMLLERPIQLHYAGGEAKPWKKPTCLKSDCWYEYLPKTPFFYEQMRLFDLSPPQAAPQVPVEPPISFELLPLRRKIFETGKHLLRKFGLFNVSKKIYRLVVR